MLEKMRTIILKGFENDMDAICGSEKTQHELGFECEGHDCRKCEKNVLEIYERMVIQEYLDKQK